VVDDFSEDNTVSICQEFFSLNPFGRVLQLSDFVLDRNALTAYKKKAIEIAISHTEAEWIVQTDADCIVPKNWLSLLESEIDTHGADYIAGPVRLISHKTGIGQFLFHAFQALDFMTMQGITMAGYYKSLGKMSNGAHVAYRRNTFIKVNGFEGIDTIASGDDMLLLDKIKQVPQASTSFIHNPQAIVDTQVVYDLKSFIHQRIRWGSKSKYYQDKSITLQLGMVFILNLLLFTLPILSIYDIIYLKYFFVFLLIKTCIEYILVCPLARYFKQTIFLPLFPVFQPLHILYVVSLGVLSLIGQYQWKDRRVQ